MENYKNILYGVFTYFSGFISTDDWTDDEPPFSYTFPYEELCNYGRAMMREGLPMEGRIPSTMTLLGD